MAVRNFDGVDDTIVWSTGGVSAMTFGTFAAIVKFDNIAGLFESWMGLHDSGGTGQASNYYDSGAPGIGLFSPGGNHNYVPGTAIAAGTWYLIVYRKATGTVAGRVSIYNFTSTVWQHGATAGTLANWTAPGASGSIKNNYNVSNFLDGKMAVRAAWANALPWPSDATGDAALIKAGLHISGQNWFVLGTSALWRYNQDSTSEPVQDLIGTAHQTSITGTDVVTGDDPPGFDFTFTSDTVYSRPIPAGRIGPTGRVQLFRRFDDSSVAVSPDATVNPDAIALSASIPQVAVSVGAAPAVIDRTFAVNQAAVGVGAAPAVIARSTVHPQVAVSVGAAPALIDRAFALPQAAVSVGVAPAVIARAFALDQVAVSVGVAPAVIALAFSLPAVTADGGAVPPVAPRPPVLVLEEAVRRAQWVRRDHPQPIVDLGPVLVVGDVEAAPNTIARSFTIPQVAVSVGVAPATIARSFTIPQATPSVPGDAIASPATIARSFVLNQVAVGVGVAPAVIARSVTIPQATPTVAVSVSAPLIARSFVMPAPAVSVGVAPAAVALAVVIPQATAGQLGDASVALALIALVFVFPEPGTETEFLKPWKLLGGGSPIRSPQKYGVRRAGWN